MITIRRTTLTILLMAIAASVPVTAEPAAWAAPATSNTWSPTGSMVHARRYHTATLLNDGTVLVVGGYDGVVLSSVGRFDPKSNAWTAVARRDAARDEHTA